MKSEKKIAEALNVLKELGLPKAQQNERSALCLLALLNVTVKRKWAQAENPLVGITPVMDFSREQYGKNYAPNTRETFRRQTIHQFVQAVPNGATSTRRCWSNSASQSILMARCQMLSFTIPSANGSS